MRRGMLAAAAAGAAAAGAIVATAGPAVADHAGPVHAAPASQEVWIEGTINSVSGDTFTANAYVIPNQPALQSTNTSTAGDGTSTTGTDTNATGTDTTGTGTDDGPIGAPSWGGPGSPGGYGGPGGQSGYGAPGANGGSLQESGARRSRDEQAPATSPVTVTTNGSTVFRVKGSANATVSDLAAGDRFVAGFAPTADNTLSELTAEPAENVDAVPPPTPQSLYAFVGTVSAVNTSASPETVTVQVADSLPSGLFSGTDTFTVADTTFVLGGAGGREQGAARARHGGLGFGSGLSGVSVGDIVAGAEMATPGESAATVEATPLQVLVDFPASLASGTTGTSTTGTSTTGTTTRTGTTSTTATGSETPSVLKQKALAKVKALLGLSRKTSKTSKTSKTKAHKSHTKRQ